MKELNTKTILKRVVAMLLAVAMCVNIPVHSVEADDTIITLTPNAEYSLGGACTITTDVTTGSGYMSAGTYYLDGVEKTFDYDSGVFWWGTGGQSIYLYVQKAATLQEGATSMSELHSHLLTIPAGTKIGSWTLGSTLNFRICKGKMTLLDSVVETTVNYAGMATQDGSVRYWITLSMPNLAQSTKLPTSADFFDWQNSRIYIDGEVKTCGEYYFTDLENKKTMGLFLYYTNLEEGVTTASDIKEEHMVTIKAGTLIQDVYVTNELNLRINPGGSVDVLTTVTPEWSKNEVEGGYRNIYYTFTGDYAAHPLSYDEGKARLILGDKSVNCEWSKYTSEEGKFGVCFRVRENFLPDAGVVILEEGTSIGNCQIGEAVYTQFSATDTTDYGTALIAVDNTMGSKGYGNNYYFYINNIPNVGPLGGGQSTAAVSAQVEGLTGKDVVNVTAFFGTNWGNDLIYIYFTPSYFGNDYTTADLSNVSVTIPAGTIFKGYYFKNSLGVTLNGTSVTDMGDIVEPEITEVPDIILPDAIVVPANCGQNDKRTLTYGLRELSFKPYGSDQLATGTNYTFATGGVYLNDATEPLGCGMTKNSSTEYYIFIGNAYSLVTGDKLTIDGTVESDGYRVQFQKTTFVVGENGRLALMESDEAYTSELEEVYVDLGENSYTIPVADNITVNNASVDVETGRILSAAGDYAVERVDGHVTYQQNVICYEIGDANADGKQNVADLIAAKNIAAHTKKAEVKGADVTNDSNVNDADLAVMRELLVGNTTTSAAREKYQELVFGVMSDTHILGDTGEPANVPILQRREKFKKALTYYKSNNAKLIIINGDVSEFGTVGSYEMINTLIDEVYPEGEYRPQFVFTADNHEYWEAWGGTITYEACQDKFKTGLGLEAVNNHYEVGGYDFISISSDNKTGSYAIYNDATNTYLETELAAAAAKDADKPIFVAIHQPEHTTVESSVELYNKLRAYPQVVLFTSHTHYLLNDERSIVQDEFTTVNTAATHYAWVREAYTNFEEDTTPSGYNFAQGLLVRVKGNTTEIDRYDIYNDQPIGVTWTITTSDCAEGGTKKYTDAARQAVAVAPTFAENTEVTADWVTLTSCTLTFAQATPATQSNFVYRYKIVVKDSTGAQIATYSYLNDFWHKNMPETVTFTIPSLDCFESYSFEITAEETYGKSSNVIPGTILSVIESQNNS